jgi:hypothetical protein
VIAIRKRNGSRVAQGDILRDVEFIEYCSEKKGIVEVSRIVFPHVVVLTQDCDLEQDYKFRWSREKTQTQDKWLLSVLVAPLYNYEHIITGEHLSGLGMKMEPVNRKKTAGTRLVRNETPRFHFLEFPPNVPLPPSVIDFKHYFSVNVRYLKSLKSKQHVCQIDRLYREDVSQRFASYLSRVGLPTLPNKTLQPT